MRTISRRVRRVIDTDLYYRTCARKGKDCSGRITMEHAFIYANKQMDEIWTIIPLCWFHHLGEGLVKGINQLLALRRATPADLSKYPKRDWQQLRGWLESQYGKACDERRNAAINNINQII